MAVKYFCQIQRIVNGIFSTINVQLSMKLFFCCSTVDYLHLNFIVSAVRVWEWDGGAKT